MRSGAGRFDLRPSFIPPILEISCQPPPDEPYRAADRNSGRQERDRWPEAAPPTPAKPGTQPARSPASGFCTPSIPDSLRCATVLLDARPSRGTLSRNGAARRRALHFYAGNTIRAPFRTTTICSPTNASTLSTRLIRLLLETVLPTNCISIPLTARRRLSATTARWRTSAVWADRVGSLLFNQSGRRGSDA